MLTSHYWGHIGFKWEQFQSECPSFFTILYNAFQNYTFKITAAPPRDYWCKIDACWMMHYSDAIMCAMASQITSLTIVYSTVYSGAGHRKTPNLRVTGLCWGIHRWPVNSPHKWPVTRKIFHLMTSSWIVIVACSVRDVAAGPYMTIIRTYYSHGEYFGHYDGENYRTPQLATSVNHIRDVMANYYYGQDSWGTVLVRCPATDNEMP